MDRLTFNQQLAETARRTAEASDGGHTLDQAVNLPVELIQRCSLAGIAVIHYSHRSHQPHPLAHTAGPARPARDEKNDRQADGQADGRARDHSAHRAGSIDSPAVSHDDARRVDKLQHELRQGPLIELRHDDTVISGDVEADTRWPRWGARVAVDFRIRSAMAFRLFSDGCSLAALSLYAEEPEAFTRDDLADGLAMAAHTGVTLASVLELDQMHTALLTRRVIGEAVGMLRERFDLSSDQAFAVLKRLSSHQNVKLARIAEQIVETGHLPDPSA
ncbi:GAF and ANTAR domain-containing protein [Nocardioides okcheonensis]|uniref:GAF and ANTAR domain-containing protein n=1 Tax=Nocardioides okcheonensis TaxID=2894081 RepID=UPI001E460265|nr:GAF and ANTAR domain-containing protein [Nocardioides okcheonensis]UFN45124.1 GAF and ANTAR domain-containing protein [Nocardioides okcheonensis]